MCLFTGELIGVEYLYDQTGKVFEPPALDVDTPEPEDEVEEDDDGDEGFVEGCGCNISRGESTFHPAVRRARIREERVLRETSAAGILSDVRQAEGGLRCCNQQHHTTAADTPRRPTRRPRLRGGNVGGRP